jgi:hypothetical protein
MTILRHIKFGTGETFKNQYNKTILAVIKQVKSVYAKHGFRIIHMLMDGQFEFLRVIWPTFKSTSIRFPTMNTSQKSNTASIR